MFARPRIFYKKIRFFLMLDLGELSICPVKKAKNLGFWFDDQLSLDAQINAVSQICL